MCSVLSNDYLALNLLQLCSVFTDKVLNLSVRDQGLEKVNLYDFHSRIFPSLTVSMKKGLAKVYCSVDFSIFVHSKKACPMDFKNDLNKFIILSNVNVEVKLIN